MRRRIISHLTLVISRPLTMSLVDHCRLVSSNIPNMFASFISFFKLVSSAYISLLQVRQEYFCFERLLVPFNPDFRFCVHHLGVSYFFIRCLTVR